MCETEQVGEKRRVSGHQLILCILTIHLNLRLFISRQPAMARKVNKHIAWLGSAANVFSLGAVFDFMSFFLLIVERPEEVGARVWAIAGGMIQLESDKKMRVTQA